DYQELDWQVSRSAQPGVRTPAALPRASRKNIDSSFLSALGIDSEQSVPRLPFLVGKLALCNLEKLFVLLCRLFISLELVEACCSKEVGSRSLRHQFGTCVQRCNCVLILLILSGHNRIFAIGFAPVLLQLNRL